MSTREMFKYHSLKYQSLTKKLEDQIDRSSFDKCDSDTSSEFKKKVIGWIINW